MNDKDFSYDEPLSMTATPASTNSTTAQANGPQTEPAGAQSPPHAPGTTPSNSPATTPAALASATADPTASAMVGAAAGAACSSLPSTGTGATNGTGATTAGAVPCAAACPLAQIPASVWQSLLRRPWRKRHPVLFWGAIILILGALGFAAGSSGKDGALMGGDRIALVSVTGPIVNVEPTLEWLRTVARNPSVKGVLVRVDSPGGGAAASQEVYDALKNLAQKMPVAVSMGSMAASGGLMVSMAGQRVFANASTVTGSIGVRMDVPQLQGLMDKVGVGQETLVVGQYKDAASYMRPMTAEQRAYFQGLLNNMYDQFVDIVAQGRSMPRAQALKLANGKVYTGQEALALGLVDELGGREMALGWLAQKTGVPAERTLLTRPRESNLLERGLRVMLGAVLGADGEALGGLAALAARGGLTQNSNDNGDARTPAFLYQF